MLGLDLTVKHESTEFSSSSILEFRLQVTSSGFISEHWNKNENDPSYTKVVRFPHAIASYPKHIFFGVIFGSMMRFAPVITYRQN